MDFRLGPKADEVRREIRTWLAANFSEEDRRRAHEDGGGHDWDLYRKLAAEGWVSAGWPVEMGGGDAIPTRSSRSTGSSARRASPGSACSTTASSGTR
ncbi:MAG: acyl-CoA dehydrogenase family protein [Myxococcota bacterium]